ncbi:hypothetical protein FJQ87_15830 [Shewanella sp. SNU WT4]|uniref:hypothetical protein n=1 Tax=Shewanella sp. SNU WT4 TaxID=2590015 RepID=UPI00112EBD0C|nr:hypothetical protein [Shewanella sp. SNU WT4]QDF67944.1 hypothetical protein FJQ87_15830 [Shewanella sp. SNU WT4]
MTQRSQLLAMGITPLRLNERGRKQFPITGSASIALTEQGASAALSPWVVKLAADTQVSAESLLGHPVMQALLKLADIAPSTCSTQPYVDAGQHLLWDLTGKDDGLVHSLALHEVTQLADAATKRHLWACLWQWLAQQRSGKNNEQ